jgi:prophage antirepressor-like protein
MEITDLNEKQITKPDNTMQQINNLLVTQFEDNNVTIYGTWEKPLFKASEIGEMLGIVNIRTTVQKYRKDDVHSMYTIDSLGRQQNTVFLTEKGLYKVILKSRKEFAQQFEDYVFKFLIEQRTKSTELKAQELKRMVAKEREAHLLERHKNKSGVYFLKHLFDPIVKFGSSNNVTDRIKQHKRSFGKERIYLDKVIETDKYIDVESMTRIHSNAEYIDVENKKHTEIIKYSSEEDLQRTYTNIDTSVKMIKPPEYSVELEIEKERTRQLELKIELLKLSKSIENDDVEKLNLEEKVDVNEYVDWIKENIGISEGNKLSLMEICTAYKKEMTKAEKTCFKGYIEREFKIECKNFKLGGKAVVGFIGLQFC